MGLKVCQRMLTVNHLRQKIKSDQNGIESKTRRFVSPATRERIKSDQNGIESVCLHYVNNFVVFR